MAINFEELAEELPFSDDNFKYLSGFVQSRFKSCADFSEAASQKYRQLGLSPTTKEEFYGVFWQILADFYDDANDLLNDFKRFRNRVKHLAAERKNPEVRVVRKEVFLYAEKCETTAGMADFLLGVLPARVLISAIKMLEIEECGSWRAWMLEFYAFAAEHKGKGGEVSERDEIIKRIDFLLLKTESKRQFLEALSLRHVMDMAFEVAREWEEGFFEEEQKAAAENAKAAARKNRPAQKTASIVMNRRTTTVIALCTVVILAISFGLLGWFLSRGDGEILFEGDLSELEQKTVAEAELAEFLQGVEEPAIAIENYAFSKATIYYEENTAIAYTAKYSGDGIFEITAIFNEVTTNKDGDGWFKNGSDTFSVNGVEITKAQTSTKLGLPVTYVKFTAHGKQYYLQFTDAEGIIDGVLNDLTL